jgi:hypothetical protein
MKYEFNTRVAAVTDLPEHHLRRGDVAAMAK